MNPIKATARGAAVLGLALLAGCSWLPWSHKKAEACPAAIVLEPLKHTAVFAAGARPAPQSVAFYGIIDEVNATCEYAAGAVRLKLAVVVIGERGPAGRGSGSDAVDFNYFVAATGPGQRILAKTPFRVHIVFPGGKPRAGVTDHIEETIPLNGLKGPEATLDVGFQQSPEVVDFYRHFRGRL
ncbi:MAG TPA: hypothetical protein VM755_05470 [Stellaceae bacterium]|nr:hypothetical protein [Stellaceae bacterium]